LIQTDRVVQAARPGEIARLVPGTPVVLLEAEDLPGLVASWRDCDLRAAVEGTESYRDCTASRMGLRLAERREMLSAALSEPISIDRLARLPGNRGGLALYNISETAFVFWLRTHHGAAEDLAVLRPDLEVERTERGGHRYLIHRGSEDTSPIAFAVVGDLLILGNDLNHFEQALALALGEDGDALGSDPVYRALVQRTPVSAQAHLYLDMGRLAGTRQFRRRWVHDNTEELAGLDRVMISVTWEEERTLEQRVLAYREGGRRLPAGPAASTAPQQRIDALPRGLYSSLSIVADATEAARMARWIWPGSTDGAPEDLTRLLEPARPTRAVEVLRPSLARDGFAPSDELAVALLLDAPDALDTAAVATAAEAALVASLSRGRTIDPDQRRTPSMGLVALTISAPLPGSPRVALSRSRDGAVLVLATGPRLANELARALEPASALGQALREPGPDVARVDYQGSSQLLQTRLGLITMDEEGGRYGSSAFLGEEIPELLRTPQLTRIERLAWRDGDFDRQELHFVE
jgi:hypothetical protein